MAPAAGESMWPKEPPPAPAILPETYAQQVAAHYACEFAIASSLAKADHNFHRIIYVMAAAGLALILGIDRFLDMCRTALNVTGDLVIATVVSRGSVEEDDAA